jgi:hypothetical protein
LRFMYHFHQDHEVSPVKTVLGSLGTDNTSQQEMKVVDRKTDKNTEEGTGRYAYCIAWNCHSPTQPQLKLGVTK